MSTEPMLRRCELAADVSSARAGRRFVADVLSDWNLSDLTDDVQLCASELIANAVRHAGTSIVLTVRLAGDLLVEVADADPELRRPVPPAPADLLATSGRGLQIVAAVSTDWGVRSVPGGKVIWFALTPRDAGRADADILSMSDHRSSAEPAGPQVAEPADALQAEAAI